MHRTDAQSCMLRRWTSTTACCVLLCPTMQGTIYIVSIRHHQRTAKGADATPRDAVRIKHQSSRSQKHFSHHTSLPHQRASPKRPLAPEMHAHVPSHAPAPGHLRRHGCPAPGVDPPSPHATRWRSAARRSTSVVTAHSPDAALATRSHLAKRP